jgi:hypothetical protein
MSKAACCRQVAPEQISVLRHCFARSKQQQTSLTSHLWEAWPTAVAKVIGASIGLCVVIAVSVSDVLRPLVLTSCEPLLTHLSCASALLLDTGSTGKSHDFSSRTTKVSDKPDQGRGAAALHLPICSQASALTAVAAVFDLLVCSIRVPSCVDYCIYSIDRSCELMQLSRGVMAARSSQSLYFWKQGL